MAAARDRLRLAAVGDVHFTKGSQGVLQPLPAQLNEPVDALLLCGDLTDYGLPEEAEGLAKECAAMKTPTLAVSPKRASRQEGRMNTLVIVLVALLLLAAIPTSPYSQSWGYCLPGTCAVRRDATTRMLVEDVV